MDYVIALGRRQRKRQAAHQRLLDIAERLFRERGIARTTVDDIAEAADVARQTFFNHFPYKEALAVELAAEGAQEVAHRAQVLLESGVSALDVLQRAAEWALERSLEDGELAVVVVRELLHSDPERALRAAQQVPFCEIFEAILVQAREEGSIRSDLSPEVIGSQLNAILRGLMSRILGSDPDRLRQELSICFDIVFNGVRDRSI